MSTEEASLGTMPSNGRLNAEEFAALLAIDGSYSQRRPPPHMELRLRRLGLIEPSPFSRLPIRTAEGKSLVTSELQQQKFAAD